MNRYCAVLPPTKSQALRVAKNTAYSRLVAQCAAAAAAASGGDDHKESDDDEDGEEEEAGGLRRPRKRTLPASLSPPAGASAPPSSSHPQPDAAAAAAAVSPALWDGVLFDAFLRRLSALVVCGMQPTARQKQTLLRFLASQLCEHARAYARLQTALRLMQQLLAGDTDTDSGDDGDDGSNDGTSLAVLYHPSPRPFLRLMRVLYTTARADLTTPPPPLHAQLCRTLRALSPHWRRPAAVCAAVVRRIGALRFTRHGNAVAVLMSVLPVRVLTQEQLARLMGDTQERLHLPFYAGELMALLARLAEAETAAGSGGGGGGEASPVASAYPLRTLIYHRLQVPGKAAVGDGVFWRVVTALAQLEWTRDGSMSRVEYYLARSKGERAKPFVGLCQAVANHVAKRGEDEEEGGGGGGGGEKEDEEGAGEGEDQSGASGDEAAAAFGRAFARLALPHCEVLLLTAPKNSRHANRAAHCLLELDGEAVLPALIRTAKRVDAAATQRAGVLPMLLRSLAPCVVTRGTPEDEAWLRARLLRYLDPSNHASTIQYALQCVGYVAAGRAMEEGTPQAAWGVACVGRLLLLAEHQGEVLHDLGSTAQHVAQALRGDADAAACCALVGTVAATRMHSGERGDAAGATLLRHAAEMAGHLAERLPAWGALQARALLTRLQAEDPAARAPVSWACGFLAALVAQVGGRMAEETGGGGGAAFLRECLATAHGLMVWGGGEELWRVAAAGELFQGVTSSLLQACGVAVAPADGLRPTDRPVRALGEMEVAWAEVTDGGAAAAAGVLAEAYNRYVAPLAAREAFGRNDCLVFKHVVAAFGCVFAAEGVSEPCGFLSAFFPADLLRGRALEASVDQVMEAALRVAAAAPAQSGGDAQAKGAAVALFSLLGGDSSGGAEAAFAKQRRLLDAHGQRVLPRGQHLRPLACLEARRLLGLAHAKMSSLQPPTPLRRRLFLRLVDLAFSGLLNTRAYAARRVEVLCRRYGYGVEDAVSACLARLAGATPADTQVLLGAVAVIRPLREAAWEVCSPGTLAGLLRLFVEFGQGSSVTEVRRAVQDLLGPLKISATSQAMRHGALPRGVFDEVCAAPFAERTTFVLVQVVLRCADPAQHELLPDALGTHLLACFVGDNASVRATSTAGLQGFFFAKKAVRARLRPLLAAACTEAWLRRALCAHRDGDGKTEEAAALKPAFQGAKARVWKALFMILGKRDAEGGAGDGDDDDELLLTRLTALGVRPTPENAATYCEVAAGLAKTFKRHPPSQAARDFVFDALAATQALNDDRAALEAALAVSFTVRAMRSTSNPLGDFVARCADGCRGLPSRTRLLTLATAYLRGLAKTRADQRALLRETVRTVTAVGSLLSYEALRERYAAFLANAVTLAAWTDAEDAVRATLEEVLSAAGSTDAGDELLVGVARALGDNACVAPLLPLVEAATVRLATARRAYSAGSAPRLAPLIHAGVAAVATEPATLAATLRAVDAAPRDVLRLSKGKMLVACVLHLSARLGYSELAEGEAAVDLVGSLVWSVLSNNTESTVAKGVGPCVCSVLNAVHDRPRTRLLEGYVARSGAEDWRVRRVAARGLGCFALAGFLKPTEDTWRALRALTRLAAADANVEVLKEANEALVAWRSSMKEKPILWGWLAETLREQGLYEPLAAASDFSGAFS